MNFKRKEGITLIALVITIIVLLILAGVSIAILTGDNGILTQANKAKEENEKAEIIEKIRIDIAEVQSENEGSISEKKFYNILKKYGTISGDNTTLTTILGNYELLISDIYSGSLSESKHINFYNFDGVSNLQQLDSRTFFIDSSEKGKAIFTDAIELDLTNYYYGYLIIGENDENYLTLQLNNNSGKQAIIGRKKSDNSSLGQISSVTFNNYRMDGIRYKYVIMDETTIQIKKYVGNWEDYLTINLPSGYTTKLGFSNVSINTSVYINNYYKDDVTYSNNWNGKIVTFYGDSITKDVNKYQHTVSQILGFSETNTKGKGGAQLTNFLSLEENYTSIPTNSDLIFVLGGTNDWGGQVKIGTIDDTSDENTFCGAVNKLCTALTTGDYSNAKIVFGTPIHRATENEDITYEEYCNAIKEVCAKYDIPVIDLYNNSGITSDNANEYLSDGVHPNIQGATLMGKYIAKELEKIQPK